MDYYARVMFKLGVCDGMLSVGYFESEPGGDVAMRVLGVHKHSPFRVPMPTSQLRFFIGELPIIAGLYF